MLNNVTLVDRELQAAFLLTYHSITTPIDLLSRLVQRYLVLKTKANFFRYNVKPPPGTWTEELDKKQRIIKLR